MENLVNNVLKPLFVLAAAAILSTQDGCKSPLDAAPPEVIYAGRIAECVNNAKTLAESHMCRGRVNWNYGLCPSDDPDLFCDGDE